VDNKTVAAGIMGGLGGAVLGFGVGRYVERKEKSIDRGLASELFAIFGSIAGGVITAAAVNALSSASASNTSALAATSSATPTTTSTPTTSTTGS
jgi:uncharacterized membrane protein